MCFLVSNENMGLCLYITCLGAHIFTVQWNMGWDSPSSTMIVFLLLIEIAPIEDKSYKFWALKISPLKHSFIQVAKRLGQKQKIVCSLCSKPGNTKVFDRYSLIALLFQFKSPCTNIVHLLHKPCSIAVM